MMIIASSFIYAAGPGFVELSTSQDYAILAKTSITTTGGTEVIGDIGISPAAASNMTGFPLMLDGDGTHSIAENVSGRIYAADYAAPTPSKLTTAISDMETAYTDAPIELVLIIPNTTLGF